MPIPGSPLVVERILLRAFAHLSRAESCRVHPSPTSFKVLSVRPPHPRPVVQRVDTLAQLPMRPNMEFGYDAFEIEVVWVKADLFGESGEASRRIPAPLAGDVV